MPVADIKTINCPRFIKRLLARDPEAYVTLSHLDWRPLRRRYRKLRLEHLTEDLRATTILKLWRTGCKDYDPSKAPLQVWVFAVGWRVALDESRRQNRSREYSLDDEYKKNNRRREWSVDDVHIWALVHEEISGESEMTEWVKPALDALRNSDREIVSLRIIDGLSFDLIAEMLGITESNARVRYSRALMRLRRELERLAPSGQLQQNGRSHRRNYCRALSAPGDQETKAA
jgi:RNA polymerase sigma-70 factor (ECF subfamily)